MFFNSIYAKDVTNWAENFTYITWTKKIYATAGFFLVACDGGCKKLCILSMLSSEIDSSCIFSELSSGVDGKTREMERYLQIRLHHYCRFNLLPSGNI